MHDILETFDIFLKSHRLAESYYLFRYFFFAQLRDKAVLNYFTLMRAELKNCSLK